jgi:AhpD family alkylhydroperoxidase
MAESATTVIEKLRGPTRALRQAVPDVYRGFGQLHDAAFAPGALDRKAKELIALAIAVVKGCEGCIGYHAKTLATLHATPEEVAEMLGVAVVMDGGPAASGHGPIAYAAFLEFLDEQGDRD